VVAAAAGAAGTAWFWDEPAGELPAIARIAATGSAPPPAVPVRIESRDPQAGPAQVSTELALPATESPLDTAALPPELANFVKTRSAAYLALSAGVPLPASSSIPADPQLWKGLADALASDPAAAVELLTWLSAQRQQPSVYLALAAFWGELVALEVLPANAVDALQVAGIQIEGMAPPASRESIVALASLRIIPALMLQDFQERVRTVPGLYADLVAMVALADDASQARSLLALGGAEVPWAVITAAPGTVSFGRQAAIDSIANQADAQSIDGLLAYAKASGSELTLLAAVPWAQRQLSGERLARLEQLAQAGAFQGEGFGLLCALLANAEDREGAAEVAGRLGVPLPATPSPLIRRGF
jgi:hypothetical protein